MKLNILILSTTSPSKHLIEVIESRGHSYEVYAPDDLYLLISNSISGYDRLYAEQGPGEPKRLLLKNFNAVITRLGGGGEYGLTVLQHLVENLGLISAQTPNGIRIASNKMWTSQKISVAGLRSPITAMAKNPKNVPFLIDKVGGLPCVVKTLYGSQGTGVIKVENLQQTKATLELLHNKGIDILLQEYVEGGGKDYRVIVVKDKVVCAMERSSKDGFKANLSQGGGGRKVELSNEQKDFCIRASKAIGLEFSGVDIMISNTDNKPYLIEINSNPGTKSIVICEYNWFEDWVKFLEEKVNAKPKDENVKSDSENPFLMNQGEYLMYSIAQQKKSHL